MTVVDPVLLAPLAFLPSVISSFFAKNIGGGGGGGGGRKVVTDLSTLLNTTSSLKGLYLNG